MMRITDSFHLLTDLLSRTNYSVTVASKNDAGVGDSSVLTFYIPASMHNKLYCQYYYAILLYSYNTARVRDMTEIYVQRLRESAHISVISQVTVL